MNAILRLDSEGLRTRARLVRRGRARGLRFGVLKGRIRYPDDFDAPLPARVLALFEGRRAK